MGRKFTDWGAFIIPSRTSGPTEEQLEAARRAMSVTDEMVQYAQSGHDELAAGLIGSIFFNHAKAKGKESSDHNVYGPLAARLLEKLMKVQTETWERMKAEKGEGTEIPWGHACWRRSRGHSKVYFSLNIPKTRAQLWNYVLHCLLQTDDDRDALQMERALYGSFPASESEQKELKDLIRKNTNTLGFPGWPRLLKAINRRQRDKSNPEVHRSFMHCVTSNADDDTLEDFPRPVPALNQTPRPKMEVREP